MKQTALEWLDEQLQIMDSKSYNNLIQIEMGRDNYRDMIQQAKEMEKEQIMDARLDGFKISAEGWNGEHPFEGVTDYYIMLDINNDKYYNETFKSE